jgi:hypothetical protein
MLWQLMSNTSNCLNQKARWFYIQQNIQIFSATDKWANKLGCLFLTSLYPQIVMKNQLLGPIISYEENEVF